MCASDVSKTLADEVFCIDIRQGILVAMGEAKVVLCDVTEAFACISRAAAPGYALLEPISGRSTTGGVVCYITETTETNDIVSQLSR